MLVAAAAAAAAAVGLSGRCLPKAQCVPYVCGPGLLSKLEIVCGERRSGLIDAARLQLFMRQEKKTEEMGSLEGHSERLVS